MPDSTFRLDRSPAREGSPDATASRLGPYELTAKLGEGGMGQVYRATDTRLGREVAIKMLPPAFVADADRLARFEREAKVLASLNHVNIAAIYGLEESGGALALVMELVPGPTLAERLEEGPLPAAEALAVARQIAEALEEAHGKGIVHRDLKPANVKLAGKGRAKVLDFGIARLAEEGIAGAATVEKTQAGALLGTVGYMAPEQVRGETADARADLFALGCLLSEMLTGRRAFPGASTVEALYATLHKEPAGVAQARLSVPLERLLRRCLAKEPGERFQSAGEAIRALDLLAASERGPSRAAAAAPSIAVLPFANLSPDPEAEYFSDGMTEEIINALTQLPELRVAARTSSFAFKGKHEDLRTVADRLGVSTLLEGSVRRAGSRLRITAQLIDAADGHHLWSERFDRELADVFAIQDEIAQAIAGKLEVTLSRGRKLVEAPTADLDAYDAYLRGRFLWERRGESFRAALQEFERAVALDPGFAAAHAGVADSCTYMAVYGMAPTRDLMPRGRAAALRALELDPALAEAHSALGGVALFHDWDWAETERRFERAIDLDPGYGLARGWYALYLVMVARRPLEALEHAAAAVEREPLAVSPAIFQGMVQLFAGRHRAAIATNEAILERDPSAFAAWRHLGIARFVAGDEAGALAAFETAVRLTRRHPFALPELVVALARTGRRDEAEAIYGELLERAAHEHVSPAVLAVSAWWLGRREEGVAHLERALAERDCSMPFLRIWWSTQELQEDALFRACLGRANL